MSIIAKRVINEGKETVNWNELFRSHTQRKTVEWERESNECAREVEIIHTKFISPTFKNRRVFPPIHAALAILNRNSSVFQTTNSLIHTWNEWASFWHTFEKELIFYQVIIFRGGRRKQQQDKRIAGDTEVDFQ